MAQGRLLTLNDQVAHLFPTPRAADGEKGPRTKAGAEKEANRGHGIDLPLSVFPGYFCTHKEILPQNK
jgi:hypothetical protein